ncbi:hypothetical protein STFE110948_02645 [Streptobacillus felis]|uniref:Prepilin-type N-terminal cleavage/methylation domain-containing protein n=1 Tax=Streptobacillus felis TaxID=1384509 RepID=A0A7Z0T6Y5_9FUSO|nr:hypothetical protein [Streptobacillus felis]NYV27726.1 hypothetical protein [Streptobacillus felis]
MKNRGVSLIEVIIYISLVIITFFLSFNTFFKLLEKQKLRKDIFEIVSTFRKYQKKSEINGIYIPIFIDLENNEIFFDKKTIKLSEEFKYLSKNKDENISFERYFTNKGNLNKGFSILIYNKKNRLMAEISFDNSNSLEYPIINVKGIKL